MGKRRKQYGLGGLGKMAQMTVVGGSVLRRVRGWLGLTERSWVVALSLLMEKWRKGCGRVKVATNDSASVEAIADDYYEVLGLVWDVLSNDEVASIAWEAKSEEGAVVEAAIGAWKRKPPYAKMDDCTVICLFFQK
ncbi:probable protein phosphatase 2C 61 [Humulus lupulus]|uniref:probable protein phosphatase 2C 61 n=1 Tax=Humulus lupulus TaxID=3486 RepID=UPI002B4174D7|nr:probable protein phosphatase 2C 61 [Humulus lupulus]XP_062097245.1 probable protein phosphatase 2C 61 [Humulus lupulus]